MSAAPGPSRRPIPRLASRLRRAAVAHPLLAILAVAGLAAAAITVTYSNTSTLATSVTPAPVQFAAGDDAGPSALSPYVSAYSISTNKTYVSLTVNGVPEAALSVGSLFKLTNVADTAQSATITTTQVSNAFVSAYTIALYDSTDTLQSTLDLRAASPSASVTIPAGETYYATLTLTLATGAGADNVQLNNALALSV